MMKNTRTLPSIHIPVQNANGSVGWAWYMFFQWVSENVGSVDLSDYFTKEEIEELLSAKANIDDLSDVAFSGDYDDLSNKPTIPSVGNGTITLTQGGTTVGTFTTNQSADTTIDIDVSGGIGRNIGDVFFTMRNDNELNGAVECNGATYNTTDFTGAENIGQLLEDGKVPYLSLADYATALATNGSVGVFGWDGTNTTAFRVPLLNDIFIETGTASQIGDYLPAGLPSIEHTHSYTVGNNTDSPYTYTSTQARLYNRVATTGGINSAVSPIYGRSNTVQPNTVRYRAMVQLAVSATDEAVETCTSVLADVADLKDHRVIAFQAPTAANNYTWYRKYADGWVEQGFLAGSLPAQSANTHAAATFSFPITMASSAYHVDCIRYTDGGNSFELTQIKVTRNTSSCLVYFYSTVATSNQSQCAIRVEGMAA